MATPPPVQFRASFVADDGNLVYESKCGKFSIEKQMVASMSGRAGYFTTPEYQLYYADAKGVGHVEKYDTLADAKHGACLKVNPNWEG